MAALGTAGVAWLLAFLMAPFAKPLAWALVIGIATMPHHDRLARFFPKHPNRSAGLMVLAITLAFILPAATLIAMIAQNAVVWYKESEQLVAALTQTLPNTLSNLPIGSNLIALADKYGIDFTDYAAKFASGVSQFLLEAATGAAKNLVELFFTLAMALFILFFVYRDGSQVVADFIRRFPANQEKARRYLQNIRSTTTAVVVGTILTCLAQGTLAGIGYLAAGLPAPALCGALTAVTALVPVVGTALVWVPLVILLIIQGVYLKAGLLALWCIVFVGLADNAIRPLAIGAKNNIPIPAIVLGAVGGVVALGLLGLIIGPLFFAILVAIWREAIKPNGQGALEGSEKN